MSRRRSRGGISAIAKKRAATAAQKQPQAAKAAQEARLRELEEQAAFAQEAAMQALMLQAENRMHAEMNEGTATAAATHPGGVVTLTPEPKKGIGIGTVALVGGAALAAVFLMRQ